jgi:hypothetical protein
MRESENRPTEIRRSQGPGVFSIHFFIIYGLFLLKFCPYVWIVLKIGLFYNGLFRKSGTLAIHQKIWV